MWVMYAALKKTRYARAEGHADVLYDFRSMKKPMRLLAKMQSMSEKERGEERERVWERRRNW